MMNRRAILLGLLGLALTLALALGALRLWSPQVFVLVIEGFPKATWLAVGSFARVEGRIRDRFTDLEKSKTLDADAVIRATDADTYVIVADGPVSGAFGNTNLGVDPDGRFNSYSMVKSLVGVLVVRALSEGRIASLDAPLPMILGSEAPDVTVNEVLTMTSGLTLPGEPPKQAQDKPLDDRAFSPFSPMGKLHAYGIEALLPDLRVDPAIRGTFHYQSANTALLGLVLEKVHGVPLEQILNDLIWEPAGAQRAYWRRAPGTGRVSAYCCLYGTARDWIRVGRYLMKNGTTDAPFLPEKLWREWLIPDLPEDVRAKGAYGWHLRHDVLDRPGEAEQGPFAYFMGHNGQVLYLLPEQDMVIVRFGARPQLLHTTVYEIMRPSPN